MKFLKYALAAAGALVLLAALFIGWFVATFDVRDYEPRIVALVKEKTGRTLTIRGETRLAFWPALGVTLGPVSLSERGSDAVFAEIANARLVAKLKPLLSKELVADELHLEGASVHLVRFRDGRLNIDDLLSSEGGTVDFDIARARVERSRIVYEDLAAGTRHEVSDVSLVTGRLRSGVATPVTLSFKAAGAEHAYALSSTLKGRLTFDLPRRAYALDDAVLRVDGAAGPVKEIASTIKANASWREGVLRANALSVEVHGVHADRLFDGTITANVATSPGAGVVVEAIALDARSRMRDEALQMSFKAPRIEWRDGAATAADASLDIDAARAGRSMRALLTAAVRARNGATAIDLTDVRSKIEARGPGLPKQGIEAALTGDAAIDLRAQRVEAKLAGSVLDSRIKATLAWVGFADPAYTINADVDKLDLDRINVGSGGDAKGGTLDLAKLSSTRASGMVRIGSVRSGGVVAKNVQLAMKP